jgi:hypothetical protein
MSSPVDYKRDDRVISNATYQPSAVPIGTHGVIQSIGGDWARVRWEGGVHSYMHVKDILPAERKSTPKIATYQANVTKRMVEYRRDRDTERKLQVCPPLESSEP